MSSLSHKFKKGMVINCTLKSKVNPPKVNYAWFLCDSANCDEEPSNKKSDSSLLRLNSLPNPEMKYLCLAENAAGSANISIRVFDTQRLNSKCTYSDNLKLCT